jgi:hypothetical protein
VAGAGETVTVSAVAGGVAAIRAVTFFRDANENGVWDAGVDQDLGADFNPADGWSRTFVVGAGWAGRVVIAANAVDVNGLWGAAPLASTAFAVSGPPAVSVLSASRAVVSWGERLTLTASAGGQNAVRAVTFFFDANSDGRWTPGVDEDLGADFNGADGWSREFTVPERWGARAAAQFGANVVDVTGAWGVQARTTTTRVNDAPLLSQGASTPGSVALGGAATLSVRATDAFGVRAVTMFVDVNNDGRWTPGVDIDLGVASRTSGNALSGVWTLTTTASWGRGTFSILADAVDTDGRWSGRPVAIALTVV